MSWPKKVKIHCGKGYHYQFFWKVIAITLNFLCIRQILLCNANITQTLVFNGFIYFNNATTACSKHKRSDWNVWFASPFSTTRSLYCEFGSFSLRFWALPDGWLFVLRFRKIERMILGSLWRKKKIATVVWVIRLECRYLSIKTWNSWNCFKKCCFCKLLWMKIKNFCDRRKSWEIKL